MKMLVHLTPKAAHNKIEGWAVDQKGQKILCVKVTAVPENGKANEALIKLLSQTLRISKSQITITRGATSRKKSLEIDGENNRNLEEKLYLTVTKS